MQCPKCHQHNCISSNKFKEETYEKVLDAGKSGHRAGYPAVAAGAIVVASAMKLADRFLVAPWRCERCDWTFS